MRWHLLAFAGAKTDSTANENIPAVQDAGWTLSNANEYLLPDDFEVFGSYVANDTITRARIVSQGLRDIGLPEIYPRQVAATPTVPIPICKYGDMGAPRLRKNDTVGVQASNGASTVDTAFAALCIRKSKFPIPPGARTTLYGSVSITAVANAWVAGTITFDQTPPVGRYSVIGLAVYMTNAFFARLIFPMDTSMRPGCVAGNTSIEWDDSQYFRNGNLGEFGRFYSVNLPQIEVLCDTAGAQTANIVMDVVALDY